MSLVNNIINEFDIALKTLSNKKWKQVLDVNLTGVFLGARAYADWHIKNNKKVSFFKKLTRRRQHPC